MNLKCASTQPGGYDAMVTEDVRESGRRRWGHAGGSDVVSTISNVCWNAEPVRITIILQCMTAICIVRGHYSWTTSRRSALARIGEYSVMMDIPGLVSHCQHLQAMQSSHVGTTEASPFGPSQPQAPITLDAFAQPSLKLIQTSSASAPMRSSSSNPYRV